MDQEQALKDILEIVQFMQGTAATKEDLVHLESRIDGKLESLESRIDQKLETVKTEIMTHIDGFAVMQQKFDVELVALRAKTDRHEEHIEQLANQAKIVLS